MRRPAAIPLLAVVITSACTGSSRQGTPAPTRLTPPAATPIAGTMYLVGGPLPWGRRPHIQRHQAFQILRNGTVVRRLRTNSRGGFHTILLPGVYTVAPKWIVPGVLQVGSAAMSIRLTVNAR